MHYMISKYNISNWQYGWDEGYLMTDKNIDVVEPHSLGEDQCQRQNSPKNPSPIKRWNDFLSPEQQTYRDAYHYEFGEYSSITDIFDNFEHALDEQLKNAPRRTVFFAAECQDHNLEELRKYNEVINATKRKYGEGTNAYNQVKKTELLNLNNALQICFNDEVPTKEDDYLRDWPFNFLKMFCEPCSDHAERRQIYENVENCNLDIQRNETDVFTDKNLYFRTLKYEAPLSPISNKPMQLNFSETW